MMMMKVYRSGVNKQANKKDILEDEVVCVVESGETRDGRKQDQSNGLL
jgi:hypothetical protein